MAGDPHSISGTAGAGSGRSMTAEEIFGLVAPKLDAVGERVNESLGSNVDIVSAMGSYLAGGGGKRLRPALLLICSGIVDYAGTDDVLFGTVFELIHNASLVHDDIIDEAATRRGRESVNRRWGNHLTVLMGDHLYIKAMQLAISGGDLRILDLLAETTLGLIEGEMIQRDQNGRIDVDEDGHLAVVRRKTALLFSACCRTPAMLARSARRVELALENYGLDLGMAYQLVDDLLDFTGDEVTLGKPTLNDLREGKLTLPLIYLLGEGNSRHVELVRTVIEDRGFDRVPREQILDLLTEHGCLARGRATAVGYVQRARRHLQVLPEGPWLQALNAILDIVVDRDH